MFVKKIISILLLVALSVSLVYYFLSEPQLQPGVSIDKIVVKKNAHVMLVYSGNEVLKTYTISLGGNPVGDKQFEGDKRTPEGRYTINDKNANSGYHKNLGISYPNEVDKAEAKAKNLSPGGEVKIHGLKNGLGFIGKFQRLIDWTAGCIAVTNDEMDELYENVKVGTPIIIEP